MIRSAEHTNLRSEAIITTNKHYKTRIREHVKKTCILRPLPPSPPPKAVSGHSISAIFLHVQIYMFLKQEMPEMDDFEVEKNLVPKEKYSYVLGMQVFLTCSLREDDKKNF